jgi:AcrR family transcriptional regulator
MSPLSQDGPRSGPRERVDAARNRARVLAATTELFAAEQADAVTVEAIAERAGVGKGTVFRRFGSLDGLLEAAIAPAVERLRTAVETGDGPLGPGGSATPAARLHAYTDALLDFVWENRRLIRGLENRRPYAYYANPASEFWIAELARRIRAANPALDAGHRSFAVFTNMRADVLDYLTDHRGFTRERIREALHELAGA